MMVGGAREVRQIFVGGIPMQQLTFVKPGVLEWWDVTAPHLEGPNEALVRPVAVATCDLDGPILRGEAPFTGPFAFGHEFVAEVVEVGADVLGVQPGQLVAVPFQISCGVCPNCRRGLTAVCTTVPDRAAAYGLGGSWGGALSDLVRVPYAEAMLLRVPTGIAPATVASSSDNLPDAWRSVGPPLQEQPGGPVLIIGGAGNGSIGLYAVAIARALGAERVDYLDQDQGRLELAVQLGAMVREGPPPRRLGHYPITVDASSDVAGLACALRSTAAGGVCTSTAIYFSLETPLPLLDIYSASEITFKTGRVQARPAMPAILQLVQEGRLHPELVTTAQASWENAIEALGHPVTKLVIVRT